MFFAIEQFDGETKEWTRLELTTEKSNAIRRANLRVRDKTGGFGLRVRHARVRDKAIEIYGKVLWSWVPETH